MACGVMTWDKKKASCGSFFGARALDFLGAAPSDPILHKVVRFVVSVPELVLFFFVGDFPCIHSTDP